MFRFFLFERTLLCFGVGPDHIIESHLLNITPHYTCHGMEMDEVSESFHLNDELHNLGLSRIGRLVYDERIIQVIISLIVSLIGCHCCRFPIIFHSKIITVHFLLIPRKK